MDDSPRSASPISTRLRSLVPARLRPAGRHDACLATVRALATSVEARDPCTGGHLERVARLGLLLAGAVAPHDARDPQMYFGFLLHDIGKLAVPDRVLNKPGRLSAEEREIMRRHPSEGARIIAQLPDLERARDVVLHHHERWDGGGYPDGLAGEEIPLWARIFAVADTLDAMTSERPYGRRFTLGEALEEIVACAGSQFDPAIVLVLLGLDRGRLLDLLETPREAVVAARQARFRREVAA